MFDTQLLFDIIVIINICVGFIYQDILSCILFIFLLDIEELDGLIKEEESAELEMGDDVLEVIDAEVYLFIYCSFLLNFIFF